MVFKETTSNETWLAQHTSMEPYSDGWVELVVLDFLAKEVGYDREQSRSDDVLVASRFACQRTSTVPCNLYYS